MNEKISNKKLISLRKPYLFGAIVGDIAKAKNMPESNYIEETIINSFLPTNDYGKSIALHHIYSPQSNIGRALDCIYCDKADDPKYGLSKEGIKEVIHLSMQLSYHQKPNGDESELYHLETRMKRTIENLKFASENTIDEMRRNELEDEVEYAKRLYKILVDTPSEMPLSAYYQLVYENFDELNFFYTTTYRLLADLTHLQHDWDKYSVDYDDDNSFNEARLELIKILENYVENRKEKSYGVQ